MKLTAEEEDEWSSLTKEMRKKVKEHIDEWFLFLDMKVKWENEKLLFPVYRKEYQQLKYIDQQSTHRPSTFKSIATGVYTRLSWLKSYSDSTANKSIDKLYPNLAEASNTVNLVNGRFPKFGEIWKS
eukprot:10400218-Ditylum_brightwellii.AAC.1